MKEWVEGPERVGGRTRKSGWKDMKEWVEGCYHLDEVWPQSSGVDVHKLFQL